MLSSRAGLTILGGLAFLLATSGCLRAVDAGHEAVLVKQPVFFGHGGVDPIPVSNGSVTSAPNHRYDRFERPIH